METLNEHPAITLFVCANCARPGKIASSSRRTRTIVPDFNWPGPVKQVIVPCTGRLQPEHVLKAFESGSSVVSVVACREDNCHYAEGSRRCARRVDYIRSLLNDIGLGDERLLFFQLPGSAAEDLAMAVGKPSPADASDSLKAQIESIRDEAMKVLHAYPPNPLRALGGANGGGDE
jgi:F420-non-reducing hydrogenase iron-sulfur subunit